MSWLTPFQNLIIRFKIGSGGSSSGGITEELLNSKLAAFYTATETKILNLVNSKLATYVTQTAFNELETKVETNTTNISNLEAKVNKITTGNGAKLSNLRGYVTITNPPSTLSNLSMISINNINQIKLENDKIINLNDIQKYIISFEFIFNNTSDNSHLNGLFFTGFSRLSYSIGMEMDLGELGAVFITTVQEPQYPNWRNNPGFDVSLILSDTLENITTAINKKSMKLNTIALTGESNTINVTSWKDIG